MSDLFALFFLAIALGGGLGTIAIWAPRALGMKVTATILFLGFVPVAYAALVELTSRPKPIDMEWWGRHEKEAIVHASVMHEGAAIYLWLGRPGSQTPRAYSLPWSQQLAQQLQEASRAAESQGTELAMHMPFGRSLDDAEPLFYALPQKPDPDKDQAGPSTALRVERPIAP